MDNTKNILLPGKSTDGQINAAGGNSDVVAAHISQITAPASYSEVFPSNTNWDADATDSSSDESIASDDSDELKEMKRELAYYRKQLSKTCEPQTEESADEATSKMYCQAELTRHHNNIKKYLKEATEEGGLKGYVYGIVLENNEVLSGTSESCRQWWNEVVKFEQTGPAAANGNQNSANGN